MHSPERCWSGLLIQFWCYMKSLIGLIAWYELIYLDQYTFLIIADVLMHWPLYTLWFMNRDTSLHDQCALFYLKCLWYAPLASSLIPNVGCCCLYSNEGIGPAAFLQSPFWLKLVETSRRPITWRESPNLCWFRLKRSLFEYPLYRCRALGPSSCETYMCGAPRSHYSTWSGSKITL